jgi:hypothetical protein
LKFFIPVPFSMYGTPCPGFLLGARVLGHYARSPLAAYNGAFLLLGVYRRHPEPRMAFRNTQKRLNMGWLVIATGGTYILYHDRQRKGRTAGCTSIIATANGQKEVMC